MKDCPECGHFGTNYYDPPQHQVTCPHYAFDLKSRKAEQDLRLWNYNAGAAVAFGLLLMAEAIKAMWWLNACPRCDKASNGWVGKICITCSNDLDQTWEQPYDR